MMYNGVPFFMASGEEGVQGRTSLQQGRKSLMKVQKLSTVRNGYDPTDHIDVALSILNKVGVSVKMEKYLRNIVDVMGFVKEQ